MFRLFGLLLVGLVLAGCASPNRMIESGAIKLGMSKEDFESKMFWGTDVDNDPGMANSGGSGYMPNFYDYTIAYGGNRNKIFVFDPNSTLVAITENINEAEQLVSVALRSGSKVQNQTSALQTKQPDTSKQTDKTNAKAEGDGSRRQITVLKAEKEIPTQKRVELFTLIGRCTAKSIDCLYIDDFIISLTDKKPKIKEQLNFFLSGPGEFRCPEGYKNYDGGNFTLEGNGSEINVSTCATASETLINNYLNNPLRLRIYSGEKCPSKNKEIFNTEKIISCQSFETNEQKLIEPNQNQQALVLTDSQVPLIDILNATTVGKQGLIAGLVKDNSGIAEVTIDGNMIPVTSGGSFEYRIFVPANGISVQVQATDFSGLTSVKSVSLQRNTSLAAAAISFDRLNPIGNRARQNSNALALIIGVSDYENITAKAVFADADAMMFRDYASEKLGIPDSRIKTMVNDSAGERELLLSVKSWLSRSVKQDQSDVYIFFAGHGLASDDGSKMYLMPYDGAPELLDDTAILRDRLFSDVAAANPRSVTVFLDTCYSGTTRGTDMLIASRPIAIRALEQSIPDNFTVMTAAAGDQTAKPLEEAKHGMFSYFLMKGMEGEADANNDNEITAGELHSYVQTNVIQQSSGSQTPELQGDADRVLVRFQ